jgi:hypothetical protein
MTIIIIIIKVYCISITTTRKNKKRMHHICTMNATVNTEKKKTVVCFC